MTGTLFANDKSKKGSSWLVHLGSKKAMRVDLPFPSGNHESAISADGRTAIVPNYEEPVFNTTEGGGVPGMAVSQIDLDSGAASVLSASANPFLQVKAADCSNSLFKDSCMPKPHGATYTSDGRLLVTQQQANGLSLINIETGQQKALPLAHFGCQTPHLVRVIPTEAGKAGLAVSGCRGTNKNTPSDYPGRVVIIDLETFEAKTLDSGGKSEGITVTASGEVWVGANIAAGKVSIFGFKQGAPKSVATFELQHTIETIPWPIRLSYEPTSDSVAVSSMNLGGVQVGDESLSKLRVFNAKTRELRKEWQLTTPRGVVNMEGLEVVPRGWYTGGYDSQTAVVVDAASLETIVTILFPRCSLPAGACQQELALTGNGPFWEQAKALGVGGYNNWGGNRAYCEATARNPFDRRQTVLDGFEFSKITPAWTKA
jgi:streptogramin lyase